MEISGGKAVAIMLKKYGVKYSFGIPGGQTYPIYLGIDDEYPEMQHLLFRCERCAAYAADGYARVTFRPGVCDGTVGPGGTHLVSGVAEAWASSIPLIVITSDIHTPLVGKNALQEADMVGMFKPFVKASFHFARTDKIPEMLRRAFRVATSGRPGPVHLNFPADVVAAEMDFGDQLYVEEEYGRVPAKRVAPDPGSVGEGADLILGAERPVIFAGGGVIMSQAWDELIELAELLAIPVATTLTGKGAIPEDHPLSIGTALTIAEPKATFYLRARRILEEADLVIFIGNTTDDISTAAWTIPRQGTKCIHIDIDPQEIGRNYRVEVGIVGDAKLSLKALIAIIKQRISKRSLEEMPRVEEIRRAVKEWRDSVAPKLVSDEVPITPHRLVKELRDFLERDAILCCDASLSSYWAGIFYDALTTGRVYIAPRGMAGIGSGLPMTIGAKIAAPHKMVMGLGGDGGFAYAVHELETMKRLDIPAVYAVLNDTAFGYGVLYFGRLYNRVISCNFTPLDYAKIAEAFGCHGIRVERPGEIRDALREAFQSGEPTVIDVVTKSEFPIQGV